MATSQYFNNYPAAPTNEQFVVEDLIVESIQQFGADVFYCPRASLSEQDLIYGEDPGSLFDNAHPIEVYLSSVMGFEGQSEFFSKFGLEIRDPMKIIMARRSFNRHVPGLSRPREGDLIWIPQLDNMFEIKFVESEKDFYQMGRRPPNFFFYEINIELYKFSNERFATGIEAIDALARNYSYTIQLTMGAGSGAYQVNEYVYQGANLSSATASATVKGWDRTAKILDIVNIKDVFAEGTAVKGNTSSANYTLTSYNRDDFSGVTEELADNVRIENEANSWIDFSESNPFGDPSP